MTTFISRIALAAAIAFAAAPAFAQAPAALPEGCERVAFTTTLIDPSRQEVHYTFSGVGSDVAAMKACNPEGKTDVFVVTPSSVAGSRVSIKTKAGNASIGMPATFVAGEIRQRVCGIKDGEITFAILELTWQDGLPKALRPTDVTQTANVDRATNVAACLAAIPVDRRAELKKNEAPK